MNKNNKSKNKTKVGKNTQKHKLHSSAKCSKVKPATGKKPEKPSSKKTSKEIYYVMPKEECWFCKIAKKVFKVSEILVQVLLLIAELYIIFGMAGHTIDPVKESETMHNKARVYYVTNFN